MSELIVAEKPIPIQNLERFYFLERPAQIVAYLEKYPFLIAVLEEAYLKIQHYFPNSALRLQVVSDPEIIEHTELAVFIAPIFETEITKNLEQLQRFDDEWWLDASDQLQDQLEIMLG